MKALRSRFSLVVASLLTSCYFASDFDGLSDGPSKPGTGGTAGAGGATGGQAGAGVGGVGGGQGGQSGDAGTDADAGCSLTAIKLCSGIPAAPAGFTQIIDAQGTEFCSLPFHDFLPKQGEYQDCGAQANWVDAGLDAQIWIVWSDQGLHVFAHVNKKDPVVCYLDTDAAIYNADALEFFFGNTASPTAGSLASNNALHLTVAPPPLAGGLAPSSVDPFVGGIELASRRVSTGFEVEVLIPWTTLGGPAPGPNSPLQLDVAIDGYGPGGVDYQSFIAYEPIGGGTQYCKDNSLPKPAEDVRTWCASKLVP